MTNAFDPKTAKPVSVPSNTDASFDPTSAKPVDDPTKRSLTDYARDLGAWGLKGAIGIPETAVGLADLATGGKAGKLLENEGGSFGLRFKQAREVVNDMHSDAYKLRQEQFQKADGILEKGKVALQNPSLVVGSIVESVPTMIAGGGVGRGLMAATRLGQMGTKGAAIAGAAGEGVVGAGSAAEQIRQQTDDGLLTGKQAGLAAATGLATGALGALGGKVANRLGIGDADTMMAQGMQGMAKGAADQAVTDAVNPLLAQTAKKSILRQMGEGAISEGVLEELPQSVSEQILQNEALSKPWSEGLDEAILMGILSGGTMGAGAAGFHGYKGKQLDDATRKAQEAQAAAVQAAAVQPAAAQPGAAQPGVAPAPAAVPPVLDHDVLRDKAGLVMPPQLDAGRIEVATGLTPLSNEVPASQPDTGNLSAAGDGQPQAPLSERMGLNPSAGGLTKAAALAVDSGASPVVQQPAAPQPAAPQPAASAYGGQEFDYDNASPEDRHYYDWEMGLLNEPDASMALAELDDSDIPWDSASNVSEEDFLRYIGATDEEIQNAIQATNQSRSATSNPQGNAAAQTNDAGKAGASLGQAESAQGSLIDGPQAGDRIQQLEAQASAADGRAADWASRDYKANSKPLPEHAKKGGPADVQEANEQRRLGEISKAQSEAASARKQAQALRDKANNEAGSKAVGANVATLAQLNRKTLPDMSRDELQQLASLLPANHDRQKKIEKALQTLAQKSPAAIETGAKSYVTQASQAQQGSPQSTQAGSAQASVHAAQGVTTNATPAQHDGAQAGATTGTQGQAQAAPAAPAPQQAAVTSAEKIAQEGNAQREQQRQRLLDASERWTRMTAMERQALAQGLTTMNVLTRKNVHTRSWADLSDKVRGQLVDAINPQKTALTHTNKASDAIESEANKAAVTDSSQTPAKQAVQPVGDEKPFAPETGTLGIPRADMPQVPTANHGGLVKHLNAQGIAHETKTVDAADLKPTQAEYSPSKVEAAKSAAGDRAVLVSSDGHIIDGHHQAVAAAEEGKLVKAIVLDAPVEKALEAVKASPSANLVQAAKESPTPSPAVNVAQAPESEGTQADSANNTDQKPLSMEQRDLGRQSMTDVAAIQLDTGTEASTIAVTNGVAKFRQGKHNGGHGFGEEYGSFDYLPKNRFNGSQFRISFNSLGQYQVIEFLRDETEKTSAGEFDKTNWRADAIRIINEAIGNKPKQSAAEPVASEPVAGGFPMAEAVQSYSGISHTGRSRAESDKQAFDKFMESAQAAAEKLASNDAQREALAAAADSLRADYLQQYRSLMSVRASTYSSFVAGRANLNSKQANSRNNALDKAMERFDNWVVDNADRLSKAVLNARTPEQLKADRDALAAQIQEKADKKAAYLKATLSQFLSFKSGDNMPYGKSAIITRVSYDKDGYPSSLTFKMADGSPVTDDKLDLVPTLKDKDETLEQAKARIRAVVDEVRAENPELTKGVGAFRSAASSKAVQNKEKIAKVSADHLNGAVKGDTITASADFEYVTGGKPMLIEDISLKGEVHVFDPVGGGRTSFRADMATARRVTFVVEKPAIAAAAVTHLDRHNAIEAGISAGTLTLADYQSAFAELEANQDAVMAELNKLTKDKLLRAGGPAFTYRMKDDKKDAIVLAAYQKMLDTYALGRNYGPSSYYLSAASIAKNKTDKAQALREIVSNTTAEDLAARAAEIKAARDEFKAQRDMAAEALANPKSLQDFRGFMRHWMDSGQTMNQAYLRLNPEQRQQYDALEAAQSKDAREAAKRRAMVSVASAGDTTAGEVIATKHTKHGHDLFVVKLAERVERDAYDTLNSSAKRLGGSYSSYRGNGAVPGFQFRTRDVAEAFQKLVGGDTAQAQELANQRRDAFDDDKSQSAAERLRTMAEALDERASEALGADRKANTARRARFAASADAAARTQQALAGTMRNIAQSIEAGTTQFLDGVRQRVQVEYLMGQLRTANSNQLQAKYPSYADQMKRQSEPMDSETVDFAAFPTYEMYRSDWANLARQLLALDGGKKLGATLARTADDVTEAYIDWAKENLLRVSHFGNKLQGGFAEFASKDDAERAIKRSGLVGKAVVLPIKRGQNRVVLSPSEAMQQGLWQGDGDKRMAIGAEFIEDLMKLGKRKGSKALSLPWQLENDYENRQRLQRMGILTRAEFRSALRELASLQQEMATPDRIKELERSMVGRANDGLDFFPTSPAVVQSMLDAAEIAEGMAVLEPSAGMGHIADAIVAESGVWPDVVELSGSRRELLEAKGFHLAEVNDFTEMKPRGFFTYGDTFRAPDGSEGVMRGQGGMGSQRVRLVAKDGNFSYFDRDQLVGVAQNGVDSGYDRIIMNPPFSDGRDIAHVQHAYNLLRPGGRIVAIMGESAFFQSNKRAEAFRDWLDERGATNEKLPDGSFMDPSLPVNTGVAARMVVLDKPAGDMQLAPRPIEDEDSANFSGALSRRPASAQDKAVMLAIAQGKSARDVLRVIASGSKDPFLRQVARMLLKTGITPSIEFGHIGKSKGHPIHGQYRGRSDTIAIAGSAEYAAERIFMHEAMHAATMRALAKPGLPKLQLQKLLAHVKKQKGAAGFYGTTNVDEFVAEVFTNPDFQAALRKMNAPAGGSIKTAWDGFVSILRSILGLPNDSTNALSQALNLGVAAMREDMGLRKQGSRGEQTVNMGEDDVANFGADDFTKLKTSAMDQLNKTFSHEGKVSLWHKTVGTMGNLAKNAPAFKPVFESAQQNIDDVSMLANDAADTAPRLLPRVDDWRDLRKAPVSAEDNKAIAKPLFEGTLIWARDENGKATKVDELQKRYEHLSAHNKAAMMLKHGKIDAGVLAMWQGLPMEQFEKLINSRFESKVLKAGIVWDESELQSLFGANANQISLYREARAAVDRSIDMTARTDMLRVVGDKYEPMREAVLEQPSVEAAAQLLLDTLEQDAKADPDSRDRLAGYMQLINRRLDTAVDLQKSGYAPLSRFGRYTVDVVDANGERQFFGMYESQRDSNLAKMQLAQEFKGATITQGTMSAEAYKLFAGVTPETLEQFGEMLGLKAEGNEAQDKAFQEFLKLTKNNHSAMKRMIHRQGIAGFSEDVGRVVANFVYSNARAGAMGLNAGKMDNAINEIPKEQGELKDLAMGLRSYIRDPQDEGQAVRGMLFAQYLGGSLASAFVNTTQPFAVTLPWLTQYGGMKKAAVQLSRALKDMATKGFKYESDLAKAMKDAEDDGTLSPQEIHQLMSQARGAGSLRAGDGTKMGEARAKASNLWVKGKVLWGQPFALAEQFNRRSTFIAAFRTAKDQGIANPNEFARNAVIETQFQYSKANKPRWARGVVGGTLFTFKTYSVSYLELMHRTWNAGEAGSPERAAGRRAVLWAMAMLLLMSGAGGVPFMEDTEDLIDGMGQLAGYNISAKQWRKQAMSDVFGKELAEFMEQGVSGLPGAPVDVSGRLGMGNLLPGTGLFLNKPNRERDLMEMVGPAGDLISRGFTGARKLLGGDVAGAALQVSPTAIRNLAKGADMAATGMYRDTKGYKVIDTTLAEAAAKAIGFQPKPVAEVQEANSFMLRSKSFYIQTSSEIKAQWADALFRKDEAALADVRERLADWNSDNPEQPIVVKMPDVWKKVREMGKDRSDRIADTGPKALRAQMRSEVAALR